MTYPNDEMPELVDELDADTTRWSEPGRTEEGTVKFLRKPAKWFIRKLASYLTGVKIPDLNSGFRAFRRDVALQFLYLLPVGFSCVTTLTMAFLNNGYSVKYFAIDYFPQGGESKFHWWKDTRRYLLQVVRMVLSYQPLKVLMPPADRAWRDRIREARLRPVRQELPHRDQHDGDPRRRRVAGDPGDAGRPSGAPEQEAPRRHPCHSHELGASKDCPGHGSGRGTSDENRICRPGATNTWRDFPAQCAGPRGCSRVRSRNRHPQLAVTISRVSL